MAVQGGNTILPDTQSLISLQLIHLLPTGDVDRLTGHVAGLVGSQEDQHVGDILIRAAAFHRHLVDIALAHFGFGDAQIFGVLFVERVDPQG